MWRILVLLARYHRTREFLHTRGGHESVCDMRDTTVCWMGWVSMKKRSFFISVSSEIARNMLELRLK